MSQKVYLRSFVVLGLACALAGCIAHTNSPPGSLAQRSLLESEPTPEPVFAYQRSEIPYRNRILDEEETSLYRVRYVRFPSIGDNGQRDNLVRGKYYESKLPGRKPMVIVLPIWGRHVYPSEKITAYLKRRSAGRINVFLMQGEQHLIDWQALAGAADEEAYLDLWEQGARREWVTITDIRRTIDWVETRADVDAHRIGIVGFSHGAMVAGGVAAQEPRLAATVLVMGSALAHQALVRCPLSRSEAAKTRAQSEFGWSLEDLEHRLGPIFAPFDPASYPGRVDPSRVLIVEAARDRCMPQTGREALWEAMGRPQRIRLDYRHKEAFLAMTPLGFNWLRRRIWEFLQQSLQPS